LRATELDIEDLTPQFVNDFLLYLDARGNKVSTQNNRLSAIHAFFEFLAELDPLRYAAQAEHGKHPARARVELL
jgi:site-specific recombinase XerD